jgi:arylsulfatase A-like enzyme
MNSLRRSLSSALPRIAAQMIVVLGVLVAAKAWLVWAVADVAPTSPRMLVALRQDLLVAVVLGAILLAGALARSRAVRIGSEVVVAFAVLANCVLIMIAREVYGLITADVDAPHTSEALRGVLDEYGSPSRYVALLVIAAAFWIFPALVAGPARRARGAVLAAFAAGGPLLLVASVLGTATASAKWADDVFEVGSFRNSPLVHYVGGVFGHYGFATMERGPAAGLDDIARTLTPLASAAGGREAGGVLEELDGQRFNVILVVLESVGMTAFDFDDPASERHPFFSRIADRSTLFQRYSSPAPNSAAALGAINCSQFQLPIGLYDGRTKASEDCRPVAHLLEKGGVRTAFFQSTFVGDWIDQPFFDRLQFGITKDGSRVIAERRASGKPVDSRNGILQEHETVSELLGWIDERCKRREPFFGVYYSWAAHAPYPLEHAGRFASKGTLSPHDRHARLVRLLDEQVERIHDAVAGEACGRPTVLLVTGDHGEAFEEHPGNRYHVMHVYEENVHVPLLVIAPGLTGRRIDRVASHADLAPTILDLMLGPESLRLAEAPRSPDLPGRPYQGHSLLRPAAPRPVFSSSMQGEGRASIRFGSFKLIATPHRFWLFDTDADPAERKDLTASHPELARALRSAFGGWVTYQLAYQGRS